MNITINIIEVASELADRDLIISYGDEGGAYRFPNGIVKDIEIEDCILEEYTDEAQEYFNRRYDYWWDFLYDHNVGDDE
jgi:hypothetical protein